MTFNALYKDDLVYTAYMAGVTAVSAGDLLGGYNNQDVTATGKAALADSDIQVQAMNTALEDMCVGIACEDCDTTAYTAVATRGLFILRAGAISTAGVHLIPLGGVDDAEVRTSTASVSWFIGRALTGASAADAYIVAILDVA